MLPPVSVLFDDVACVPAWFATYRAISNNAVPSGYTVDATGNVPADPASMAAKAARTLANDTSLPADIRRRGARLTLEEYTLARNMTSEVGTTSIGDAVCVGQCAVNRAALGKRTVVDVLVYRQPPGHPNRGFYGPINVTKKDASGKKITAPFGRWASTSKDPTVRAIVLAQDILAGVIPTDFNKGADDQANLTIYKYPGAAVRNKADDKAFWVGPIPGVNHRRTMAFRTIKSVDTALAIKLVERGLAALSWPTTDWSKWPVCGPVLDRDKVPLTAGDAGAVARRPTGLIVAASALVATVAGYVVWERRRGA